MGDMTKEEYKKKFGWLTTQEQKNAREALNELLDENECQKAGDPQSL